MTASRASSLLPALPDLRTLSIRRITTGSAYWAGRKKSSFDERPSLAERTASVQAAPAAEGRSAPRGRIRDDAA